MGGIESRCVHSVREDVEVVPGSVVTDAPSPPDVKKFAFASELAAALERISALEGRVRILEAPRLSTPTEHKRSVGDLGAEVDIQSELAIDLEETKWVEVADDILDPAEEAWRRTEENGGRHLSRIRWKEVTSPFEKEHPIQASVWDLALIAFTPVIDDLESVGIVVAIVINITLQLLFCIVSAQGLGQEAELPSLDAVIKWRETVAHQHAMMDQGSWVSLAEQVCELDPVLAFSGGQADMVSLIDDYVSALHGLPGIPKGPLLGILCLILWLLSVAEELRGAWSFCLAVLYLPRGKTRILLFGDELAFESITRARRVALLLTTLTRALIAAVLTWVGANWLVATLSISDMLLNAVALTFVLGLDEVLFATVLPALVQVMTSKIRPLTRPLVTVRGVDVWPVFVFLWCSGFVVYHFSTTILDRMTDLKEMKHQLCGGDRNFVLIHNLETNLITAAETGNYLEPSPHESEHMFFRRAAHQFADVGSSDGLEWSNVGLAFIERREDISSKSSDGLAFIERRENVEEMAHTSVEEYTPLNPRCLDFPLNNPDFLPDSFFWAMVDSTVDGAGGFDSINRSQVSCQDYEVFCTLQRTRMLRIFCPITCGCADPYSGLLFRKEFDGCPVHSCQLLPDFTEPLRHAPCQDMSTESLRDMDGWQRYWESYRRWFLKYDQLAELASGFIANVTERGCSELARDPWRDSFGVCRGSGPLSSVRSFCPVTCGCLEEMSDFCPTLCATFNASES